MISESVIEVFPIFDGFISGTASAATFFPLQFEPVQSQHAWTLFILNLLKKIVESGIGCYSFETHQKSHDFSDASRKNNNQFQTLQSFSTNSR